MLGLLKNNQFQIKDGRLLVIPEGSTANECECCLGCPPRCSRESGGSYYPIEYVKEAQLSIALSDVWQENYHSEYLRRGCNITGTYLGPYTSQLSITSSINIEGFSQLNGTYLSRVIDLETLYNIDGCSSTNLCYYFNTGGNNGFGGPCSFYDDDLSNNPCINNPLVIYHNPVELSGTYTYSSSSSNTLDSGLTGSTSSDISFDVIGLAYFTLMPKFDCNGCGFCNYNSSIRDTYTQDTEYALGVVYYLRYVNGTRVDCFSNSGTPTNPAFDYCIDVTPSAIGNRIQIGLFSGDPDSYFHRKWIAQEPSCLDIYFPGFAGLMHGHLNARYTNLGWDSWFGQDTPKPINLCKDCNITSYTKNRYECDPTGNISILDVDIPPSNVSCSVTTDLPNNDPFLCGNEQFYTESSGIYTSSGLSMQAELTRS